MRLVTVFAACLALSATPALAQSRRGGRAQGRDSGRAVAAPRAEAPRTGSRPVAPPTRSYDQGRYGQGRAVPRPNVRVAPRVIAPAPRYYGPSTYSRGYYGSRGYYVGPRYSYRPYTRVIVPVRPYYRPYYAFRPHFSIGFGIFLGYPVPYPYYFGAPTYVYPYPPSYPSYPSYPPYGYDPNYPPAPYGAPSYGTSTPYPTAPQQGTYGGVSFEITPDDAAIYVDGTYVGVVRDFSPTHQPLTLTTGPHHIELQAQGCAPLTFDVTIVAGQVMPYRGALQPY